MTRLLAYTPMKTLHISIFDGKGWCGGGRSNFSSTRIDGLLKWKSSKHRRTAAHARYGGARVAVHRPRAGHCLLGLLSALVRLKIERGCPPSDHDRETNQRAPAAMRTRVCAVNRCIWPSDAVHVGYHPPEETFHRNAGMSEKCLPIVDIHIAPTVLRLLDQI